jgi:hypothetical protein
MSTMRRMITNSVIYYDVDFCSIRFVLLAAMSITLDYPIIAVGRAFERWQ